MASILLYAGMIFGVQTGKRPEGIDHFGEYTELDLIQGTLLFIYIYINKICAIMVCNDRDKPEMRLAAKSTRKT